VETKQELQKIIEGCVKNKRKYQKKLFDLYYGKMLGVCLRYAKNPDEAKDMVQNGFIKVFDKLEVYNFTGSLEGWIRRIMVNTAIDQIRKNKRDPFQLNEKIQIKNLEDDIPFEAQEADAEIKIKAELAIKAISELPPGYRTVFNLFVIEGYTHKEIADYLHISEGTSKSNLAKAKQKLRQKLS
jgi:RNA polymerase sigma-70 factor (ECF subfamily)